MCKTKHVNVTLRFYRVSFKTCYVVDSIHTQRISFVTYYVFFQISRQRGSDPRDASRPLQTRQIKSTSIFFSQAKPNDNQTTSPMTMTTTHWATTQRKPSPRRCPKSRTKTMTKFAYSRVSVIYHRAERHACARCPLWSTPPSSRTKTW